MRVSVTTRVVAYRAAARPEQVECIQYLCMWLDTDGVQVQAACWRWGRA